MAFDPEIYSHSFLMQNFLPPANNALKMALQTEDSKLIGEYLFILFLPKKNYFGYEQYSIVN